MVWKRQRERFSGDMEVMRSIIALDPELDPRELEYWRARLRMGGGRRVLRTLAWIAALWLACAGFVFLIFRLAKWLAERMGE